MFYFLVRVFSNQQKYNIHHLDINDIHYILLVVFCKVLTCKIINLYI